MQLDGAALNEALQYGPSAGLNSIRGWLTDLQAQVHKRELGANWAVSLGSGSQDLMSKVGFFLSWFPEVRTQADPSASKPS